jgi:hypothetical protein
MKSPWMGFVSVSLDGPLATEADMAAIVWEYAGSVLSLAANGGSARVTARQDRHGTFHCRRGKAVITVTHPLSANTPEINVHAGDEYEYRNTDAAYISTCCAPWWKLILWWSSWQTVTLRGPS